MANSVSTNEMWEGQFNSTMVSYAVYGTVKTQLPVNYQDLEQIDTEIKLTYQGLYNNNKMITIPIHYNNKQYEHFVFNGELGNQRISFKLLERQTDIIVGTYSSKYPSDEGTFTLYKVNSRKESTELPTQTDNVTCNIM